MCGQTLKNRLGARQVYQNRKRYIPASLKHQATLRDSGQCTFKDPQGKLCGQARWLEIRFAGLRLITSSH
jgi:hypothetical protein